MYEYLPTQPDELHLVPGDFVYITDKNIDDEGWYRGESIATGAFGVFPDNFVEEEPEVMKASSVVLKDQGLNSLTTSSVSISSLNNSLSKQKFQAKNADEHEGSRGSREKQIADWQALIATLRAKKSLEQYALSKKRTEFK